MPSYGDGGETMYRTKKFGKRERRSYAKIPEIMELPDLIEIQKKSYEEFLQKDIEPDERKNVGLQAAFLEVFPISNYSGTLTLEFVNYSLGEPKYDVVECQERGMTFAAPLKVKVRLIIQEVDKETGNKTLASEPKEQDVYMGELPIMTETGTFIVNGAERVIVSQLHRSPGIIFEDEEHVSGRKLYSSRIIPYHGAWIEFEYDTNDVIYVRLDRRKKMPATLLLRALGWGTDEEILRLFSKVEKVQLLRWIHTEETLTKGQFNKGIGRLLLRDVVDEKYGEIVARSGEILDENMAGKIDTANVELIYVTSADFPAQLVGRITASNIVNKSTGEVIVGINVELTKQLLETIRDAGIEEFELLDIRDARYTKSLRNTLVRDTIKDQDDAMKEIFKRLQPGDPPTVESAKTIVERKFFDPKRYDLSPVGRYKICKKLGIDVPLHQRVLRREDIIEALKYLMKVEHGMGAIDDIDHLGNRRVRSVGELLQMQFRNGLARVEKAIKERMTIQDIEDIMPHDLINSKPLSAAIKDFFGSSQLSQFMQQTNPLDELTHKRRLSALGPGGLHRDRATFEVRDVHHTHYGRLCPIETPEGPSVGLIVSLSTYARVNEYGFLETPYRKVTNGVASEEIEYLSADQEDPLVVAQANAPTDENNRFVGNDVLSRFEDDFPRVKPEEVNYMDVSPNQIVSVSAALIPFLEHDDANRALMGSNMQRQAVPLINPQAPIVGTGMEHKSAKDSGAVIVAKRSGMIESVSADEIIIRADLPLDTSEVSFKKGYDVYRLTKFKRSNNGTCINQRPLVKLQEKVEKGQVIADGTSTEFGELALGNNVLSAFMPWEGYNFEDAIVISERLVKEDIFTSIHIEEFELESRDTKLGREEFTRDIPNLNEDQLRNLDDDGIILEGSIVKPMDILIGRVTPKGESELRPEEKLLRAIFGEKAGDVRDASLTARPGVDGVVVGVKVFSRREKEKDKATQLREGSLIKTYEKRLATQVNAINERKNEEVRELLLEETLASNVSNGDDFYVKKGSIITKEMLDSGVSLDEFVVKSESVSTEIQRIYNLAEGRIEELTRECKNKVEKIEKGDELRPGVIKLAKVYVASKRKIDVGDKLSGRHGNKGVIAKILPEEDMPYLPNGTPVDVILNPLGVPSRMNVGQVLETHLGWAAKELGIHVSSPVFDGAKEDEIKEALREANLPDTGQITLYDGRTGEPFDRKVTVGVSYIMKLIHLVEDKIHARSIGPYSLVTQQPLGGKAQFGGQRFGEMEVWALEAYGAAHLLQEMLTVKSDDVSGRTRIYEAIVKGENAPEPGTPESFNVLVKELQSLCLDVILERSSSKDEKGSLLAEKNIGSEDTKLKIGD
jgi:DNA-directed RNA polymerase subunit beta